MICWTDANTWWLSGGVAVLAMFPLNSVLFPYMPLRLRVFEERYLIMLAELLRSEDARFGVVLIERGREVGGGEECFSLGTIAEITQLGAQEGFVGLIAQGSRRFEVTEWLDDAPHPRAEVREMAELEWDNGLWRLREVDRAAGTPDSCCRQRVRRERMAIRC